MAVTKGFIQMFKNGNALFSVEVSPKTPAVLARGSLHGKCITIHVWRNTLTLNLVRPKQTRYSLAGITGTRFLILTILNASTLSPSM